MTAFVFPFLTARHQLFRFITAGLNNAVGPLETGFQELLQQTRSTLGPSLATVSGNKQTLLIKICEGKSFRLTVRTHGDISLTPNCSQAASALRIKSAFLYTATTDIVEVKMSPRSVLAIMNAILGFSATITRHQAQTFARKFKQKTTIAMMPLSAASTWTVSTINV